MKRSFGDMDLLQQSNNVEKLLRGMIRQPVEKADSNFVDDVSMIRQWIKLVQTGSNWITCFELDFKPKLKKQS